MTGPYQISPTSMTSYAQGGGYRATIESIDDPEKRGRVQVRIFGYQDDKGLIPKENLEWIHVVSGFSQIPGSSGSHGFYPGAQVLIGDHGTERYVIGAIPGFDGEKRLASDPGQLDNSDNVKPDTSPKQRGEGDKKDVSFSRNSPGLIDGVKGLTQYFEYGNWPSMIKKIDSYVRGKGAPPAPYGKGDQAKLDKLKSIGFDKTAPGSDVLNVINALDGNLSGAFQAAVQIIQNLRMSGFGNGMEQVGAGAFQSAVNQYDSKFGSTLSLDFIELIPIVINAGIEVQSIKSIDWYSVYDSGRISFLTNVLFDQRFNTDISVLRIIEYNTSVSERIGVAHLEFCQSYKDEYKNQCAIALTSLLNMLVDVAQTQPDVVSIVAIFGGTDSFVRLANNILRAGNYLGVDLETISNMMFGAVKLALTNNLPQVASAKSQASTNSSGMNVMSLLNIFMGNSVASSEIMSGMKKMESLAKIALKYEGADDPEHPRNNKPVKRFGD